MVWDTTCAYQYDGSYAGFLCCVFDSYTHKEVPVSITAESDMDQATLYAIHTVSTNEAHARRVRTSLRCKSAQADRLAYRAFLTCLPEREMALYRFFRKVFNEGTMFLKNPTDPALYPLWCAVRQLGSELEKLRGFLRFSEFNGLYAAEIDPKNRVLPALRAHFCSRFADQPFVIYDRTHKEALLSANGHWTIQALDSFEMAAPSQKETDFRRLWKTFFDTIAIQERTNPTLQRQHVPLRYRSTMTEFQNLPGSAPQTGAAASDPASISALHESAQRPQRPLLQPGNLHL